MNPLGYRELAARWGVKEATLRVWKVRGKLPPPDVTWGGSPGWYTATIEEAEKNGAVSTNSGEPSTTG